MLFTYCFVWPIINSLVNGAGLPRSFFSVLHEFTCLLYQTLSGAFLDIVSRNLKGSFLKTRIAVCFSAQFFTIIL